MFFDEQLATPWIFYFICISALSLPCALQLALSAPAAARQAAGADG
jgi:hypothetical protein